MFVKDDTQKGDHRFNQKYLMNRINLKKTAYVIKDEKIEVEEDETDVQIKEKPTRLREQISKLKSG